MQILTQRMDFGWIQAWAVRAGNQRHGAKVTLRSRKHVPQPWAAKAKMSLRAWVKAKPKRRKNAK